MHDEKMRGSILSNLNHHQKQYKNAVLGLSLMWFLNGCVPSVLPVKEKITAVNQSSLMLQHIVAFDQIAQTYGNQRAVGSKGGEASASYILETIKKTPYSVQMLPFKNVKNQIGQNIILEIVGKNKEHAIMVGAHYDSAPTEAGLNKNASGVSVLLSLIQDYAVQKKQPPFTLYFAFWDSSEVMQAGSSAFVKSLSAEALKGLHAYIHVEKVGTPRSNMLIYDAKQAAVKVSAHHLDDFILQAQLKAFARMKNSKFQEDHAFIKTTDAAAFVGKVPIVVLTLAENKKVKNFSDGSLCVQKACDDLNYIDAQSLQLSYEALWYLLEYIGQHK